MFGPSGTCAHGPTGTANSVLREPESDAGHGNSCRIPGRNHPNRESCGFLLTAKGLSRAAAPPPPAAPRALTFGDPPLTHVTLVWREGVCEDWLRFGKPVRERIIDRRRRVESYAPGQIFALVRWASNDYGTQRSECYILRAVDRGEALTTLPQVDPGAEILLAVRGWPKVRAAFGHIDAIEEAGFDPCAIAPDHWRHIHNRLAAGMPPRRYDLRRHRVWHLRRKLQP